MSEQERVNFVATNHDAAGGTLVAHIQDLSSHPRLFISKSTLSGGGAKPPASISGAPSRGFRWEDPIRSEPCLGCPARCASRLDLTQLGDSPGGMPDQLQSSFGLGALAATLQRPKIG